MNDKKDWLGCTKAEDPETHELLSQVLVLLQQAIVLLTAIAENTAPKGGKK